MKNSVYKILMVVKMCQTISTWSKVKGNPDKIIIFWIKYFDNKIWLTITKKLLILFSSILICSFLFPTKKNLKWTTKGWSEG